MAEPRPIVIAGAGIAGLAAALAFARNGRSVRILERSPRLAEAGAGLQLSPNATRILDRLGVLPRLRPSAVQPEAIVLRAASDLRPLAEVPLGQAAERRWKAPYLVAHRADLQQALLATVAEQPAIEIALGAAARDYRADAAGAIVSVDTADGAMEIRAALLVAADGVWSRLRQAHAKAAQSRFTGHIAWRRTVTADSPEGAILADVGAARVVTAFLHPKFHLVAYPVNGGASFNLVAFTPGQAMAESWSERGDASALKKAMRRTAPALAKLAEDGSAWTFWPIHTVETTGPWTAPGFALIGDAAHAMTPFAAQGAAMAIEDAETLAAAAGRSSDLASSLAAWEARRRPRVAAVRRRGAFNRFVWHASGPIGLVRNLFLQLRSSESLAADMDWLYGWDGDEV